MFTSLDQVVARWAERYAVSGSSYDKLPSPGYTDEAIRALEEKLGIVFHPSFRHVLLRVNLDTVDFRGLGFGNPIGKDYLACLSDMNPTPDDNSYWGGRLKPFDERTFLIAGGESNEVILDNRDGALLAGDHESRFGGFSPAAANMERFICLL